MADYSVKSSKPAASCFYRRVWFSCSSPSKEVTFAISMYWAKNSTGWTFNIWVFLLLNSGKSILRALEQHNRLALPSLQVRKFQLDCAILYNECCIILSALVFTLSIASLVHFVVLESIVMQTEDRYFINRRAIDRSINSPQFETGNLSRLL